MKRKEILKQIDFYIKRIDKLQKLYHELEPHLKSLSNSDLDATLLMMVSQAGR